MRILILILVCLISVPVLAQVKRTPYYDQVSKAEQALVDLSREEALGYYEKAFAIHTPFTRDLLNAYYCALQMGKLEPAKKFLYALLQRGIKDQHLSMPYNNDVPRKAIDSVRKWIARFEKGVDKDSGLRAEMLAVNRTALDIGGNLESDIYVRDSFNRIYENIRQNSDRLFRVFSKHGVPGESAVGNLSDDPLLPVLYNNALRQYFKYIDKQEDRNGIDSMLFKAVLSGDYHPEDFVTLLADSYYGENHLNFRYGKISLSPDLTIKTIYVRQIGKRYFDSFCKEGPIDAQRKILGLDSLETFRKKVLFSDDQKRLRTAYSMFQLHDRIDYAVARHTVLNEYVATEDEIAAELKELEKCK